MFSFSDFQVQLQKIRDHIVQDESTLRTGRATISLLDPVHVEAYGTMMKVSELANVSTPDPTLIVIAPWDKSMLDPIVRVVNMSGLNLNPINDGEIVRIAIPPLTEDRRKEMVKLLAQKIEAGKVMVRTLRGDVRKEIEGLKGEDGVSEDNIKNWLAELDKKVKEAEAMVDEIKTKKETELMKM